MTQTLDEFWNFDETDLAANRNGQLSEKQKKALAGEHTAQKNVFLGVGVFVILLFVVVPALVLSRVLLSEGMSLREFLPPGLGMGSIIAIAVPILAIAVMYALRAGRKADTVVRRAGGRVAYSWGTKRVYKPGNSANRYEDVRVLHISIGDRKFQVHEDLQQIIREGETWNIYYTSHPFKFLSGEMTATGS